MNIFFLSRNVSECAYLHHNIHVIKMCLEYSQLLSSCHRILDGEEKLIEKNGKLKKHWELPDERENILYKVSHKSHPSNIWVRQSSGNYRFLYSLLKALCTEYRIRYGRQIKNGIIEDKYHSVENLLPYLKYTPFNIPEGDFIPPQRIHQAMPEKYKDDDFVTAYRNYYVCEKNMVYYLKTCGVNDKNKIILTNYHYAVPKVLQDHLVNCLYKFKE